jgi:hypothetical protein
MWQPRGLRSLCCPDFCGLTTPLCEADSKKWGGRSAVDDVFVGEIVSGKCLRGMDIVGCQLRVIGKDRETKFVST